MKTVLVTGGFGFLGRHTAKLLSKKNYNIIGLGRGQWKESEEKYWGFNKWISGSVSTENLSRIEETVDCVIHCGGGGSVGASLENPQNDFNNTVVSTSLLLEYMEKTRSEAKLIYPSSAAVHGAFNKIIHEDVPHNPVSPYGVHKGMAENLCLEYSKFYKTPVNIIRFFSLYGEGLKKQLLWDACNKFRSSQKVVFWGDGTETRDWLHIDDAASLIATVIESDNAPAVMNGASGKSHSLKVILETLADKYHSGIKVSFNGSVKEGDPKYFEADISKALSLNWIPKVNFEDGIDRYVKWFKAELEND